MSKSVKKDKDKQISEEDSIEYVKEIYDDLLKIYQVLFEHIDKVDQLIKEKKSKDK